jgi:hypothetical protein
MSEGSEFPKQLISSQYDLDSSVNLDMEEPVIDNE